MLMQAVAGYSVPDVDAAISAFFSRANESEVASALAQLLQLFHDEEASIATPGSESEVVTQLLKSAKGDAAQLQALLPKLIARKHLKSRVQVVQGLLRQLTSRPALVANLRQQYPTLHAALHKIGDNKRFAEGVCGPVSLFVPNMFHAMRSHRESLR